MIYIYIYIMGDIANKNREDQLSVIGDIPSP